VRGPPERQGVHDAGGHVSQRRGLGEVRGGPAHDEKGHWIPRVLRVGHVLQVAVVARYEKGFGVEVERRNQRVEESVESRQKGRGRLVSAAMPNLVRPEVLKERETVGPCERREDAGRRTRRSGRHGKPQSILPGLAREAGRKRSVRPQGLKVAEGKAGGPAGAGGDRLSTLLFSLEVLRRKGIRKGRRRRPGRLYLMEETRLVENRVGGRMRKGAEVPSHHVGAILTREKGGLPGAALWQPAHS